MCRGQENKCASTKKRQTIHDILFLEFPIEPQWSHDITLHAGQVRKNRHSVQVPFTEHRKENQRFQFTVWP